jgi:hypothetical protein
LEIPHFDDKTKMMSLIVSECMKNDINIPEHDWFNPEDFKIYSNEKLIEMHKLAISQEGVLLSTVYVNSQTPLKWRCKEGHEWKATPNSVKRGAWCKRCGNKRVADSSRGNIEEMRQLAILRGGDCLSSVYVNANSKLSWRCKKYHQWYATPGNVKSGHWCSRCNRGRNKDPNNWTTVKCLSCGSMFEEKIARRKEGRGKFCSKQCFDVYRKGKPNTALRKGITRKCEICGKSFETLHSRIKNLRGKFCSKECYYKSKKGKPSGRWSRVEIICKTCGKKFLVNKARKGSAKYCSKVCAGSAKMK